MVHSVCSLLAHRAVSVGDLSFRLASDAPAAYFRHRGPRSIELDQCNVLSPGEAASRTTRYLTCRSLPMITAELTIVFSVSPSFCSTWNRSGEVVVKTGPPVENAVETVTPTFSVSKRSPQPSLRPNPLIVLKPLTLQDLFVFIAG